MALPAVVRAQLLLIFFYGKTRKLQLLILVEPQQSESCSSDYHLLTLVCHLLILSLAVIFLWSNATNSITK
ncbi:hypothetical protein ZIOFF_042859 [Zingiber officinale]|uniref:Uncharacterized protein n=1 Tax=Zingiber officinale TaxID=94328 RepID=A0A8J5KP49_ZINOF|nr:hypothetical protein ZIOFF_042859 [Zingiber officinale]